MLNSVHLIGYLGCDPELKTTANDNKVCTLRIATTKTWMKGTDKEQATTWHNIVAYGKRAESCAKYLKKGRLVFIEGEIQNRVYEKDGIKRTHSSVVVSGIQFLSTNKDENNHPDVKTQGYTDNDIPF